MKKTFRIDYETSEGEQAVVTQSFEDWSGRATLNGVEVGPVLTITARDWAEDLAYSLTDKKGSYIITEVDTP